MENMTKASPHSCLSLTMTKASPHRYLSLEALKVRDELFEEGPQPVREQRPVNKNKQYETAYRKLNVTPLVEIHSVTIHGNKKDEDGEKCEIYGKICVADKLGDKFNIFSRGKDEAEAVKIGGSLLLSSPLLDSNGDVNVILPSEYVSVNVLLFNKTHNNMLVAKGEFELKRTLFDCRGEQISKHVPGDGGFAKVHYDIFPYAVVATVELLFFSEDDTFDLLTQDDKLPDIIGECDTDGVGYRAEPCDQIDYINYDNRKCGSNVTKYVFGTVTACSDIAFIGSDNLKGYDNASVLARMLPEQSVQVTSGSFIKLSRSTVAVPAYSSLKIEVDLSDCDTQLPICRNVVEFKPEYRFTCKKDIVGDYGRIRVRVKWSEAYQQLYRPSALKRSSDNSIPPEIENVEKEKRQKLLMGQASPSAFSCIGILPTVLEEMFPERLVEVFSIAVCAKDFEPFHFYGKITVNGNDFCIFDKDANRAQHCPALGTLVEITGEGSFDGIDGFSMWVDLKDNRYNNNASVISKGNIIWPPNVLDRTLKWLDKRLCSVIRGERGFAVVHYSIIHDALSVLVDVKIYGKTASSRVYGKLVARYGNHDYSGDYEKEYYQSVLFHKKDAEDGHCVDNGCNIPLLKKVVVMPRKSSLVLEAGLFVTPGGGSVVGGNETVILRRCLEFKMHLQEDYFDEIIDQDVRIVVSVKLGIRFYQ